MCQHQRTPIQNQKLIYHLTALDNLEGILANGLLPRNHLNRFADVADPDIIEFRGQNDLNNYVPFHFFFKNPFDGRVQNDYSDTEFAYICLDRIYARSQGFQIIPKHPMAVDPLLLYNYDEGFNLIEWDIMNTRQYADPNCKNICMAECVAPRPVMPGDFYSIVVESEKTKSLVEKYCRILFNPIPFYLNAIPHWFL